MTAFDELREAAWIGMDAISDPEASLNDYADAAAREVLKTLPALVKPLVWKQDARNNWVSGNYSVNEKRGKFRVSFWAGTGKGLVYLGSLNTLEAAKAAANAHHVAQVMAAMGIQQIGESDD